MTHACGLAGSARNGAKQAAMDGREPDVPVHVSETARQLRDLDEEAGLPSLVYLLGVVSLEADNARAERAG